MSHFLGLDIGTTTLKSILYDAEHGQVIRVASRPTPVFHPQNGWSEHDPDALWDAVKACMREAAAGQPVAGLAISSMAETGVLLDAAGKALAPAIAWYDRRSEPQAARIEQQVSLENLYRITGQRVSPSFALTKILWLRENQPQIFRRGAAWLPISSYLLWRLTGIKAVDYTIASRTLAFDQRSLAWSDTLLKDFDLPGQLLPPVFPGGTPIGAISPRAAQETGLPPNTLCALGGHDHLCASLAAGGLSPGAVTDSTGSASALLMLMPAFLPDPALARRGFASYAYVLPGLFVLKGGLKAAGSAIEWLARELAPTGDLPYAALEEEARQGVGRRAGPLWLPHLIGSGTPQGDRFSRAALAGVQLEHNRGDLFRGMLESIGFWTRHNLEEMQALTGLPAATLTLIGGVTRLGLLSQLKADITNHAVKAPRLPEAAAVGAALLAGIGAGYFASPADALASLRYECTPFEPDPLRAAWYDEIYHRAYLPLYAALQPVNLALHQLNG